MTVRARGEFDWRAVEWNPTLGRGGFVPRWIKHRPLKFRTVLCQRLGHPLEAIEPFVWLVDGRRVPGHMCIRCYQRVDLKRLLP